MNLVEHIKDQLSQESAGKLGALISEGEGKTRAVLAAAVPSLLSAFASLTTLSGGPEKLAAAVSKFEPDLPAKLNDMTTGEAQAVLDEGQAALKPFFTEATLSAIVDTLTRNTGLSEEKVRKLLGYLTALVLGSVAGQLKGQSATPANLTALFADQKANLAAAMPAGLSLDEVPGIGSRAPTGENGMFVNVVVGIVFLVVLVGAGWYVLKPGGLLARKDGSPATPTQATTKK